MEENYQDKTIRCKDCGNDFVIEASEQKWYVEKEFSLPLRCPDCRAARKNKDRNNSYDRR